MGIACIHAVKMKTAHGCLQNSCGMAFALLKHRVTGSPETLRRRFVFTNNNN